MPDIKDTGEGELLCEIVASLVRRIRHRNGKRDVLQARRGIVGKAPCLCEKTQLDCLRAYPQYMSS